MRVKLTMKATLVLWDVDVGQLHLVPGGIQGVGQGTVLPTELGQMGCDGAKT